MHIAYPRWRITVSPYVVCSTILVVCAMLWRWNQTYIMPLFDVYPLYYGALAWINVGNAYDLGAVVPQSHTTSHLFQVGNGYPLPAVLLILPLTVFPPQLAATLWVGGLVAGLLLVLRLLRAPFWLLLYMPLIEAVRIEQYTALIVILQLAALWALQTRRYKVLAVLCALILTKPTQGVVFVGAMLFLARNWKQQALAVAAIWGGSFLLDPDWLSGWFSAVATYSHGASQLQSVATYTSIKEQPIVWLLLLLLIPLLLIRDVLSIALVAQLILSPFAGLYAAAALPLSVLYDPRSKWLIVLSHFWVFGVVLLDRPSSTLITLVVPMVILALLQHRANRDKYRISPIHSYAA